MIDQDITRGFIGQNGIDAYMIDIIPSKVSDHIPYPKDVIIYTYKGPNTFKPVEVINDIDSVLLYVTTYSGSEYVLHIVSGSLEVGTIGNKRVYFKTDNVDDVKVLKLFVPY